MCDLSRSCEENRPNRENPASPQNPSPPAAFAKYAGASGSPANFGPQLNRRFDVNRLTLPAVLLAIALPLSLHAQSGSDLVGYFTGKQVLIKIDMPGTQKGDRPSL